MAGVKLVVMYPRPKDIDAFEKVYQTEHVPMAVEKLGGKDQAGGDQGGGIAAGHCPVLPHR